jgi:hypothetical protein
MEGAGRRMAACGARLCKVRTIFGVAGTAIITVPSFPGERQEQILRESAWLAWLNIPARHLYEEILRVMKRTCFKSEPVISCILIQMSFF